MDKRHNRKAINELFKDFDQKAYKKALEKDPEASQKEAVAMIMAINDISRLFAG